MSECVSDWVSGKSVSILLLTGSSGSKSSR